MKTKLIILDRDGIINELIRDPNTEELDSPMDITQSKVFEWIPLCLKTLNIMNYSISIATNQPGAAKGKITKERLTKIHHHILREACQDGAEIGSHHICFHRMEDGCQCRKPNISMLQQAFIHTFDKSKSWMIGDLHTDIQAGNTFGLNTALINSSDPKSMKILEEQNIAPTFVGKDLRDFVDMLKDKND